MALPVWVNRETVITATALGLLVGEVALFGARPSVLTTLLALLSAPVALRLDAWRKKNGS